MEPHAPPSISAVKNSFCNARRSHFQSGVNLFSASAVTVTDCALTLSLKPSTIARKNARMMLVASVAS